MAGLGALAHYGNTPGSAGAAEIDASGLAGLALAGDRPTVVMYAHPRCPCTSASLESLARLQRRFPGRFATRVVFTVPRGMGDTWHCTALWEAAGRLPDCDRIVDPGGEITQAAGAATSGTVAVYASDGQLQFWGGVTPSRAHAGDSAGGDAMTDYFQGRSHAARSPVFGCPLVGCDDEQCLMPRDPTQ